jgi:Phage terminase, small subunit.
LSQKRRSDKNSVTGAVQGFQGAIADVKVPAAVMLQCEEEKTLWSQFTRARAPEDWREMDLILLAKVVKMEAELRRYRAQVDIEGVTVENARGTMVVNPLLNLIDTTERRQLAVVRSLGLNQQHSDPRTLNAGSSKVRAAKDALDGVAKDGLIAVPDK